MQGCSAHVNGNVASMNYRFATGYGISNVDGTATMLATAGGFTFVGTITIPALAVTGSLDLTVTATAADEVLNADLSMNHATANGVAVDGTAVQLTTARTGGYMTAFRGATTSLAGDLNASKYYDFLAAAPTDGGGSALHIAFGAFAGHDRLIDASAAATGQNDVVVPANVADAWNFGNGTLTYWTLATTTASPGITETWAHTGTAVGHAINETIDHATQVGVAVDATAAQLTTARTGGYAAAYRAKTTSLAGDLNGVIYAGLYCLAPTDGGGAAVHVGVYDAGNDYAVWGLDNVKVGIGTGAAGVPDDFFSHNGTNTIWVHATGNLIFDNTLVTGATYMDLGTDTAATEFAVRNNSGTRLLTVTGDGGINLGPSITASALGELTMVDGSVFIQRGKGTGTGDVIQQIGATATEAFRLVVYDATVSPSALETNLINLPAGSMLISVQAVCTAALTGGGTTVTWSVGTSGDPDHYGSAGFSSITGAAAADSLAQNSKIVWFGDASHAMSLSAAAEQLVLTGCATGGAADGNTALTVGSVRVRVIYWQLQTLDNA